MTVAVDDAAALGWRVVFADVADEWAEWPVHDPLKLGRVLEELATDGCRSMTPYPTLDEVDVSGLSVLVRSDLNVPIDDGAITDDFRIRAALPTLERLVDAGAKVTVCSHLGRPEGADPAFSLRPVAARMGELTSRRVAFAGEGEGQITVMENTRFDAGEAKNDPATAERLAAGVDLFVQDAFGSVHRAHASTVGVAERVRSVAGPLLDAELKALGRLLGRAGEALRNRARWGQGLGQARGDREPVAEGRRDPHRRRHVLHAAGGERPRGRLLAGRSRR